MTFNSFCVYACRDGLDWAKTIALASKVRRAQVDLWSIRFNFMMRKEN